MNIKLNNIYMSPLYGYTDRHCHYVYSLLNNKIKFCTEMINVYSFVNDFCKYSNWLDNLSNLYIIIQFSGNNLLYLYKSSLLCSKLKFSEINFNVGCPSNIARKCNYGVYLMNNVRLVLDCLNAIYEGNSNIKISIKHRLGFNYSYEYLRDFVGNISLFTKCRSYIIHSRIMSCKKKNNKNNFSNFLINYKLVYRLKKDFPHLEIVINGNIKSMQDVVKHLHYVDGVMIGRGIYFNPLFLCEISKINNKFIKKNNFNNDYFFYDKYNKNKISNKMIYVFYNLFFYIKNNSDINLKYIYRHIFNLFNGVKNSDYFKNKLYESMCIFHKFKNFNDFLYFIFYNYL